MDGIELHRFEAADRDWLVRAHEAHYSEVEEFDASFGVLVARIVDTFLTQNDPAREAGWIAWKGERRVGSIFCVGLTGQTAKLRLFLLTQDVRGNGLGAHMLAQCMGFARDAGYRDMQLWTHESHRAAGALYARTGWTLTGSRPVVSFGKTNVEQTWTIRL